MTYNPDQIRTPNMPSDRSADVHLDPKKAVKLADGSIYYPDASKAQQSFAQECDINYILKNNAMVAPLTPEQYASLRFEDLGDSIDYHQAKNYLFETEKSFMSLDASLRARFNNDPGAFLDFVQDPNNQDELINLGLATRSANAPVPEPASTPSKQKKNQPQPSEEADE